MANNDLPTPTVAPDEDSLTHTIAEQLWRRQSDVLERKAYTFEDAPSRMHYLAHGRALARAVAAADPRRTEAEVRAEGAREALLKASREVHGYDLNPTRLSSMDDLWWINYLEGLDRFWRDTLRARAQPQADPLPLHRTEAGYPNCATCDGGGCPDCTDLA